jgi:hypothetical protein
MFSKRCRCWGGASDTTHAPESQLAGGRGCEGRGTRTRGLVYFGAEMKARAVLATAALVTAVAAAVGAPALADRATPAKHPSTAVESCATQSGAEFPHAFTSRRNLVVGPLSVTGAGRSPAFVWNSHGTEGFQKFPLLVREGHRVKLELSPKTRRGVGLAYGPLPQGETYLRDTYQVVTFVACKRGQHSWSSADGQPVTFWSGSVLARSPRCVPLLIWVDGESVPRRAIIRLGVHRCG